MVGLKVHRLKSSYDGIISTRDDFFTNETILKNKLDLVTFHDLVWFGFMEHQPLYVIIAKSIFYTNKQFYFKQFSLNVKNSSISDDSV